MWVFKERSHSWPWTRPPFLWLDNYPSRTVSTPFVVSPNCTHWGHHQICAASLQSQGALIGSGGCRGKGAIHLPCDGFRFASPVSPPHSFFVFFSASEVQGSTSTTNQVENPVLKVRLPRIQPRIYILLGQSGKRVRSVGRLIKPTRHLQLISELIRRLTTDFTNCSDALLPSVGVTSLGYPIITEGVDCVSHTCSVAVMFEELHRLICLILKLVRFQSCVDEATLARANFTHYSTGWT